jgi:hypothetical protein
MIATPSMVEDVLNNGQVLQLAQRAVRSGGVRGGGLSVRTQPGAAVVSRFTMVDLLRFAGVA